MTRNQLNRGLACRLTLVENKDGEIGDGDREELERLKAEGAPPQR